MTSQTALFSPTKAAALTAAALCVLIWLAGVMVRLGQPRRSARLHLWVRRLERHVEQLVFLTAVSRLRPPPLRRRMRGAPAGVRISRRRRARLLLRSARIARRGESLYARVARLIAVLRAPHSFVARFIKRLRRGLRPSQLVLAFARAEACAPLPAPCVCAADSS